MSYFAAAVARDSNGWTATEVSLADVADVEDVADRLREAAPSADVSLLFVESDDTYLAILRLDRGEDLRIFGSDIAFAEESRLGALLLSDVTTRRADLEAAGLATLEDIDFGESDDEGLGEEPVTAPVAAPGDSEPAGDADLLADLGVPAKRLIELCTHNGLLASDITAELCQIIGCIDVVDELREA